MAAQAGILRDKEGFLAEQESICKSLTDIRDIDQFSRWANTITLETGSPNLHVRKLLGAAIQPFEFVFWTGIRLVQEKTSG